VISKLPLRRKPPCPALPTPKEDAMNFERDGKPTPEFLDSDAYYDDPPPQAAPRPTCGPCRGCGRSNERFTLWAKRDLCTGCAAAIAAAAEPPAAKEAA
jgi:hypothetical protein